MSDPRSPGPARKSALPRPLKLRKSAGTPVTGAVHRLLAAGNHARDAKDWAKAASCYREALDLDPALTHIWIQFAHALKENGDLAEAERAYRRAETLDPTSAEPHLHLGHLRKVQGDLAGAGRCYLRAIQLEPGQIDAIAELQTLALRSADVTPEALLDILAMDDDATQPLIDTVETAVERVRASVRDLIVALGRDAAPSELATLQQLSAADNLVAEIGRRAAARTLEQSAGSPGPALVFDVSDLIAYFHNARLPTGIQRVQIEIITSALRGDVGGSVRICCFAENRDEWLEIPATTFAKLCRLSTGDGDRVAPEWSLALARLRVTLSLAEAMTFEAGAYLINLGTSWWLRNYFLFVRQAKARFGIRYVPFVHDLIPVMAPEHCTKELTQDFISWIVGAFEHADFFLVNSQATKRDLLTVGNVLGRAPDEDKIAVVRLDADFRKPTAGPTAKPGLGRWGLNHTPFVLFVSTIESRKNHLCAFEAWIQLVRTHGPRKTPKLVCVGNRGWLNDAVYAQLSSSPALEGHVVMLSGLSDMDLAQLYEGCLFTLYPSRYEGWGLPVTESLCHGKVPLVSDTSSLPEAGGDYAVYFEAGSTRRLTEALERLIFDSAYREARERLIAETFSPRTWRDVAEQVGYQVRRWAASTAETAAQAPPQAQLGAYHPIVRNHETRIWSGMRSAEIFRAGDGWWGPDAWGCWTKAPGGRLEIGLPRDRGPLRAYFRLHGLPQRTSRYRLSIGERIQVEGSLPAGEFKWLSFDLPAATADKGVLHVVLEGDTTEDLSPLTQGLDPRLVSVGLTGFFLCESGDAPARAAFLEAIALDDLGGLAFGREPNEPNPSPAAIARSGRGRERRPARAARA